jgi:hypothetical protein
MLPDVRCSSSARAGTSSIHCQGLHVSCCVKQPLRTATGQVNGLQVKQGLHAMRGMAVLQLWHRGCLAVACSHGANKQSRQSHVGVSTHRMMAARGGGSMKSKLATSSIPSAWGAWQRSTQHSTQHSTAQHSTAQHSTAQHSTAQHSTATPHVRAQYMCGLTSETV